MESKREINGERNVLGWLSIFMWCMLFTSCGLLSFAFAADNPLLNLREETASYFKPVTGIITAVEGKRLTVNLGTKDSVKKGMRFEIFREEAPFIHPVTKEPLGELESLVGKLEIKAVGEDSSKGELVEGTAQQGDKVRISALKVNILFCQSRDTDWHLADDYHRMLKEAGRFNLVDTSLDTDEPSKAVEEAKRLHAEVTLLLTMKKVDSRTVLTQRLFWTADGVLFSEESVEIEAALLKEIGAKDTFFEPAGGEEWLHFDLAFDSRHIAVCDIDGDGKDEVALSSGNSIGFYTLGAGVQPARGGIKIGLSNFDDLLWLDAVDLNGNGRDEIVITSMKGGDIVSYIYEVSGPEFVLLYKERVFMRRLGNRLVAQEYSRAQGYAGDVFNIVWDGGYKKGEILRLPKAVNIYDFTYIEDSRRGRLLLAYDEDGFLTLYDGKDTKIWRSKTDMGGFLKTFERKSSPMIDRGEWSIKDRLIRFGGGVLVVKRAHFVEMIKGLGFKNAQMLQLRWNGLSMEEEVLMDDISGTLYDYTVDDGRILVLSSPLFGVKPERLLRGESPLKTELSVYLTKGL